MFPRNFSFAGDVATSHASDPSARRGSHGPESTRSLITTRAEKIGVSGRDQQAYLMTRGCAMNVPSSSRFHHASSDNRDPLRFKSIAQKHQDGPTHLLKIGWWIVFNKQPSSTRDRGPILRRSWPDRRAIVVQSAPKWSSFFAESTAFIFNFIRWSLIENRQHDRSPIVARSGPNLAAIGALFEAKSCLIQGQSGSYNATK